MRGECLGLCPALWGWIPLHRVDERVGEKGQNSPSGKGREVHTKPIAREAGGSLEETEPTGGDAG